MFADQRPICLLVVVEAGLIPVAGAVATFAFFTVPARVDVATLVAGMTARRGCVIHHASEMTRLAGRPQVGAGQLEIGFSAVVEAQVPPFAL